MNLLLQFIRKDFYIQRSYRFDTLLRICGIALQLTLFFFIGKLIHTGQESILSVSKGEYFPFVLIGLAFAPIFSFGLSFVSGWIREETGYGTLERVLSMPVPLYKILLSAGAGRCLGSFIECGVILLCGFVFLDINFSINKIFYIAILLVISAAFYFSVGVAAGSFILIFKRGDPIQWVLINFSDILGGVYFPVILLPGWLKAISNIIPTTHILNAARSVILADQYASAYLTLILLLFAGAVCLIVSVTVFASALRYALKKGILGHF